jgi:hypothetical protein
MDPVSPRINTIQGLPGEKKLLFSVTINDPWYYSATTPNLRKKSSKAKSGNPKMVK